MMIPKLRKLILVTYIIGLGSLAYGQEKVLVFASCEDTYYSEYIVMIRALEVSGYQVDVVSSGSDSVSIYMLPSGTDIQETAGTLPGGSYSQFTSQFADLFGGSWDSEDDPTPEYATINGSILDVVNMDEYAALVVVGGTGALDYRVDGDYQSQGVDSREISTNIIQQSAEKLNILALEALSDGKPVLAQCHGASIPAFWRIPNTESDGVETLGISLIKGGIATGFPELETEPALTELGVTHRTNDRVTITTPNSAFDDNGNGDFKIITTRDWYPQSVAHAARTLINILESYPRAQDIGEEVKTLILHGGEVDVENCSASNRNNDVPCNYGVGDNLPADFTDLEMLLEADSDADNYTIIVENLDIINGSIPASESEWNNLFDMYDAVVWYKHWSTGVTENLQNALVTFADDGGGVVALHHGLYNDIDGPRNKDILVSELFEVQSSQSGWSGNLANYNILSTGYGHFISTYGIEYETSSETPSQWFGTPLRGFSNASYSYYQSFEIFDEIYNNMSFEPGADFGNGLNEITPLFSNNQNPGEQVHTNGFVKLFDGAEDGSVGRVVFFQAGERKENYNSEMPYGQLVRNAVVWSANQKAESNPVSNEETVLFSPDEFRIKSFYPNPFNPSGVVEFNLGSTGYVEILVYDILGRKVQDVFNGAMNSGHQSISIDGKDLSSGVYIVSIKQDNQRKTVKITLIK